jgi:hypothetical protein
MGIFSKKEEKKEELHTKEYEEIIKRVYTLEARLNNLELENTTLRDKVLRKIQFKKEVEEQESTFPKAQNLNRLNPFAPL